MDKSHTSTPGGPSSSNPLYCRLEGHDGQPLNLVCTSSACPDNGLICADCMSIGHVNHINKCISLQVYLARIKKNYNGIKDEKEKKIKEFHHSHEENLKLINSLTTKLNSALEDLAKTQVEFFNNASPELEKLICGDKDEMLENITKIEKKSFEGSSDWAGQFIKGLLASYQVDTGLPTDLIQKSDDKKLKNVENILKDSEFNLNGIKNYLKTLEATCASVPKQRPFRGKKIISLKDMVKKYEVNEPTGMLVLENILSVIPDKKAIVSGNKNGDVNIREYATGKLLGKLSDGTKDISALHYFEDIKKLATSNQDLTMKIWDVDTLKTEHTFTGLKDVVLSFEYLSKDKLILTGDAIGYLYFWDLEKKKLEKSVEVHRKNWVKSVLLLQNGESLATSGSDNFIRIWKLTDNHRNVEKIRDVGKIDNVGKLILFENDCLIYGSSGKAGILNHITGEIVKTIQHSAKGNIVGLTYLDSEGVLLTFGNGDNKIKAWTKNTWEQEGEFDVGNGICSTAVIDDEGYYIAVYGNSKLSILREQPKN
jgi:hypothetical protein